LGNTVVNSAPTYVPLGEQALIVQYEKVISIQVTRRVQSCAHIIENNKIPGIQQVIPSYNCITIYYDPITIAFDKLVEKLRCLDEDHSELPLIESKTIHLPVVFGGNYGPDLEEVSQQTGFSPEEVIQLLQSKSYFVYMIGQFAGFPYCGDIDERLSVGRRSSPKLKVEKGTVLIVNNQTGVYPMTAPSGWHMVGWTPMEMFNPYREPPSLLRAGDCIQYIPIRADQAERWDEKRQREWDEEWNPLK